MTVINRFIHVFIKVYLSESMLLTYNDWKKIVIIIDINLSNHFEKGRSKKDVYRIFGQTQTSRSISISISRVIPRGVERIASCNLKQETTHQLKLLTISCNQLE